MDRFLKHTGFGWDDDDKMIKASEESWEDLISDKNIQEYRDKVWPSWIDLQDICASSMASGVGAISSKGKGETSKAQIETNVNEIVEVDSDGTNGSPVACPKKPNTTKVEKKKKGNASGPQNTSKGQKTTADDAINAIDRLADASLIITEAYSVKACMQVLNSMPSLEPNKKLKAAQAFEHVDKRAIFIEMDEETRSLWVENA
ncbi:hypothetical protein VPH35_054833 [Triticum aestivum]